ncbi:MAG TPA: hypothetical protein EYN91_09925 [Candidatus Melainabacteria bacterium]|jgi:hypothetical protein|nr:hypothetical protein [Candidatus Melainabacteria bacterium]HIN64212.1 hypothetical protein [Candidatus Obscuribacterales bacterium]
MDKEEREQLESNLLNVVFASKDLTDSDAAALERELKRDPNNTEAHLSLFGYHTRTKNKVKLRPIVVREILWIIENLGTVSAPHMLSTLATRLRPKEFAIARERWLALIEQHSENANVAGNAGYFIIWFDYETGERQLRQAGRLDPGDIRWSSRYAQFSLFEFRYCADIFKEEFAKKTIAAALHSLSIEPIGSISHFAHLEIAECALFLNDLDLVGYSAEQLSYDSYGPLIQYSNCLYGLIAVRTGNIKDASEYLLKLDKGFIWQTCVRWLAEELLAAGERKSVAMAIQNLTSARKIRKAIGTKWLQQVKDGEKPSFEDLPGNWY